MCTVRMTAHNIKVIENSSGNVIESDFVRSIKNAVSRVRSGALVRALCAPWGATTAALTVHFVPLR
jgi:hypothetical protein